MKSEIRFSIVLTASLLFAVSGLKAQIFTTLHNFTGSDGRLPEANLITSGGTLYGTTANGGANDLGTAFSISTNGSNYTVLHSFSAVINEDYNSDGAEPEAGLLLSGGTLYGTTSAAGPNGSGTVFSLSTNGGNFTVLHAFSAHDNQNKNSDGAFPSGGLIISGNTLYGTAYEGGTNGSGAIFSVSTNGVTSPCSMFLALLAPLQPIVTVFILSAA